MSELLVDFHFCPQFFSRLAQGPSLVKPSCGVVLQEVHSLLPHSRQPTYFLLGKAVAYQPVYEQHSGIYIIFPLRDKEHRRFAAGNLYHSRKTFIKYRFVIHIYVYMC